VQRARLRRGLLAAVLLAALPASAFGSGALLEVNDLVMRTDAHYRPAELDRHRYTPIDFSGYVSLAGRTGGPPPALERIVLGFDHDGRLSVAGLPRCAPARIEGASTAEARRVCRGAIVGRGRLEALILLSSGAVKVRPALTVFNGPRTNGKPTALVHVRTEVPFQQTYAVLVPISRRGGEFRYWATFDVPPVAAGLGRITRIKVELGRRYRAHGKPRSYLAARCSDSIQRIHGDFRFADGTIISGALEKFCDVR
jgi:hypothetical protein